MPLIPAQTARQLVMASEAQVERDVERIAPRIEAAARAGARQAFFGEHDLEGGSHFPDGISNERVRRVIAELTKAGYGTSIHKEEVRRGLGSFSDDDEPQYSHSIRVFW